jgi:hypothetical protein
VRLWSDFYSLVMPWAPGCAEIVADAALRQAAIEFFQETLAWQRTLDPSLTITTAGYPDVACDITADEAIVKLLDTKLDGRPLTLARADDFDGTDEPQSGMPSAAYTVDQSTVLLYPAPAASGMKVTLRVALKPSQAATGIADAPFEQYASAIAAGALARLCTQPGTSYLNPGIAGTEGERFEAAKSKARARAFMGNARTRPRVTPSYF